MATSRLLNRTPSARVLGYGCLNGHKLAFDKISKDGSGKATIERSDKSKEQVWGVLYSISKDEMEKLDEAEGKGYERQSIVLDNWDSLSEWDEGKIEVVAYLATKRDSSLWPYHWYKEYVIVGAVEHELPKSYIDSIRDAVSIQDLDDKRRAKHEAILGLLRAQLAEPDEDDQVKDIFS